MIMPPIRLLSWGANSHSQLGHGFQSEQLIVPEEVNLSEISLEAENIKKIVGGAGHSLILDKYGCVYACGWNSKGQTGIPGEDIVPKFKKIESLTDEVITDIDCGWDSTMCLNENGEIFVWGSNSFGQLGIDPQQQNCILQPQKIIMNEKIERFSLGLRHTALVTETGKILTSGTGGKCQLGLIDSENKPIRRANIFTEGLSKVTQVSCGQHHTVAKTKDENIFSWGDNKHGQLGLDSTVHPIVASPLKIQLDKFSSGLNIYTGWTHTAVLVNGKILAWGRNTYGQLGCPEFPKATTSRPDYIKNLPEISDLSVGSEHNIALTGEGKVLCWGWNEHGNCGNGNDNNVIVPEEVAVPQGSTGLLTGVGAGHSFAVVKLPY